MKYEVERNLRMMRNGVFVDVEAPFGARSPASDNMTEFGAVMFADKQHYHGHGYDEFAMLSFGAWLEARKIQLGAKRLVFWSDNPAYDWQWINYYFDKWGIENPFGHSARRIGDLYAGLVGNVAAASEWKALRVTVHDHTPVNDAMGNVEAVERFLKGERPQRTQRR